MALHPVARALAQAEVQLGAGSPAEVLRVGAGGEDDVVEEVAVDHGDRSGVVDTLDGVDQKGRGYTLEGEVHVVHGEAANGEFTAEVVTGRDAGQRLHGAKRIVGDEAAKLLKLAAGQRLFADRGCR